MDARQELIALESRIDGMIEEFEKRTGFIAWEIKVSRGGCTDGKPYQIYGVHITLGRNDRWKPE